MIALRLWKLKSALPTTLGEMLEKLLKARCTRDAESSVQGPGTEVILRLAGALAFQCLVVDHRLECPALEAGRCIRAAKRLCEDALGVADMTEIQVVALLARHELLQVSGSGHLSFGHQLLAGALAAPVLSCIWRDHINCLGEPVADDAWIFAARLVSREHVEDFLESAFHVMILGARTAKELPSELQIFAERLLDCAVAEDSPETIRVQGLFALARLGSRGAIEKLRKFSRETHNPVHYAACQALAATGDLDYLCQLLPEVDHWRSSGIKVSGGEVGIWEAAPLPTRLDLARQRLMKCIGGESVGESLSLLAYERDPLDVPLVEKHLHAATHLVAWQSALYALHKISPMRAKEALEEKLSTTSKPTDMATFMHSAALIGLEIDVHAAFDCAIAELLPDEPDDQVEFHLYQLISDVVAKFSLPPDLIAVIEHALPSSSGERRDRLWQIASGCKSSLIAEYAASCIGNWGSDVGNACNFFIAQPELARVHRQQLVELCENGFENEQTWYDWNIWRALMLVGELGFSSKAANHLSAMIKRLVRVQSAMEAGDLASLSPGDAEVLKSIKLEHIRFHLGQLIAQLIPAAAKAREFLSDDILLSLLYFDTKSYRVVDHLREALSGLSDAEIDEVLNKIEGTWTRLSALVAVCARGSTKIRVDMLACELRQNYAHSAALHLIREAIEACWCRIVCGMVAKTVAEIPAWSEYDSQFFWNFFRAVARRVGPDDQAIFETEVSRARTDFARRILKLWCDQASGERIGLARIS